MWRGYASPFELVVIVPNPNVENTTTLVSGNVERRFGCLHLRRGARASGGGPSGLRVAMARVPRRRRVAAALALVVAATCAASSSGHPLDPFHELVDDPATTVVRGPGSIAKQAETNSGSGAADAVAAAVDS